MLNFTLKKWTLTSVILLICAAFPVISTTNPQNNVEITTITKQSSAVAIPIAATVGSQFTINIPANHTTGYKWAISNKTNTKVIRMLTNVYNEPTNPMPGKGGSESWTFKAVGKGKATIVLNYIRPWEKNVPPVSSQTFTVTVQ